MVELNGKKANVDAYCEIETAYEDLNGLVELFNEEEYQEEKEDLTKALTGMEEKLAALSKKALLSGEYDANDCYLSIHAGSGGTEAMDWAGMLMRM